MGLDDVSKYPDLFDALAKNSENHTAWTQQELRQLAGENFLRVMDKVEQFRDENRINTGADRILIQEDPIPPEDLSNQNNTCRSDYIPVTL